MGDYSHRGERVDQRGRSIQVQEKFPLDSNLSRARAYGCDPILCAYLDKINKKKKKNKPPG